MIVAVLSRHAGLPLGAADVFVNVAGGVRIDEPGADLGIALAIASAAKGVPVREGLAAFGEIGLTGRLRPATQADRRLEECRKFGLRDGARAGARRRSGTALASALGRIAELSRAFPKRGEFAGFLLPCQSSPVEPSEAAGTFATTDGTGGALVQGRRQGGVPAPRCRHGREAREEGSSRREARVPDDQDPAQRHDRERPRRQRRARRSAQGDRRRGGQEGRQVPDLRWHRDAEELEPPLQAQPRQDEDRRHLRARRGRPQPRAARRREGPLDRREADVRQGEEDPRLRAHVREEHERGRGARVARGDADRGREAEGGAPRRSLRPRRSRPPAARKTDVCRREEAGREEAGGRPR